MRVAGGGAAILLGAAVGATAALALRENAPPPGARPALSARAQNGAASPAPTTSQGPSGPSGPPAAATEPFGPPPVSGPPTASTGAVALASKFPFAAALPPATSVAEVERSEIRCYETAPEECGRAADAYDLGQLVPRDAERAAKLRKIELTRLVRACEKRSPHACLVLAGRYESGQGVPENDKHAQGLLEHARDLCHQGVKVECAGGEPQ